jgi:hypothetical protein
MGDTGLDAMGMVGPLETRQVRPVPRTRLWAKTPPGYPRRGGRWLHVLHGPVPCHSEREARGIPMTSTMRVFHGLVKCL